MTASLHTYSLSVCVCPLPTKSWINYYSLFLHDINTFTLYCTEYLARAISRAKENRSTVYKACVYVTWL